MTHTTVEDSAIVALYKLGRKIFNNRGQGFNHLMEERGKGGYKDEGGGCLPQLREYNRLVKQRSAVYA